MTDSSASSDCSSIPLWPGGSAFFLFFVSQDYLYSFSCRWVSEESGPSTEKETCRVTLQRPSCPLPKLWMGPPPESPPTEAWRSDMWGSSDCWGASGGKPHPSISSLDSRLANTDIRFANNSAVVTQGTSFGQNSLSFLCLKTISERLIALPWNHCGTVAKPRCSNVDSQSNKQASCNPPTQ